MDSNATFLHYWRRTTFDWHMKDFKEYFESGDPEEETSSTLVVQGGIAFTRFTGLDQDFKKSLIRGLNILKQVRNRVSKSHCYQCVLPHAVL